MKTLSLLIGLILAFVSLAGSVHAYGTYGQQSLGYYGGYGYPFGYQESTDFYKNFNFNKNANTFTGSNSGSFQNSGSQFSDLFQSLQGSGSAGFSNNQFQSVLQDNNLQLLDGYSFTKGPCVTETLKGNFHGKSNDFTINREVCDNIEGTFFKNNKLDNTLRSNNLINNNEFGTNAYQNQYSNQNTLNSNYQNQQAFNNAQSLSHQDLSVSFGKGTRIVLN